MIRTISKLLLLIILPVSVFATTFQAIVVADTAEHKVRGSAKADIKLMQKALKVIAKACGKKLKFTLLKDSKVTAKNLDRWLFKSDIAHDDIIFFYFTGHGLASTTFNTIWPDLCFKTKAQRYPLSSIIQVLEQKKARLTIILSDSCNNFAPIIRGHGAVKKGISIVQKSTSAEKEGIRKLFLHNKGKVYTSGAVRGTTSWGSEYGGYFTQAFLMALQKESLSSKPSWKRLCHNTAALLHGVQQPQFSLFLNK